MKLMIPERGGKEKVNLRKVSPVLSRQLILASQTKIPVKLMT
jgi:hypothetical protein